MEEIVIVPETEFTVVPVALSSNEIVIPLYQLGWARERVETINYYTKIS